MQLLIGVAIGVVIGLLLYAVERVFDRRPQPTRRSKEEVFGSLPRGWREEDW